MEQCKTVLITGASRGIGSEIARHFALAGYQVVINYNKSEKHAKELARELEYKLGVAAGEKILTICADVADRLQVDNMFDEAEAHFGGIDVLVNNAGIAQQKLFTELTDDDWRKMFAIHVDGAFYCSRRALQGMIRRHSGKIVNVSSMWGQIGGSCEVHYSAAKAAVIGMTRALAKEVGPCGIQVNCVAPGVIDTEMNGALPAETLESLCEETPLGALGTCCDIAEAVFFLADSRSDFITGQVLGVNGGMVIG
ncbi:elongation factor P 5-aminopentanone reductase [Clostridium merdae]|uniref:elongation factor P 5-aminopentanone reductase n=1 Tax=Clostridium merdae TaxID=1958780 RepID=UPI000A2680C9|nr:3-oxoacyl-ACP reductase FabG [Clostridium merdae]